MRDGSDEAWMELRSCTDQPTSWWFPEGDVDSRHYNSARMFCTVCTVRQPCLSYAIENGIWHGMWGGLAPLARRKVKAGTMREQEVA